MSGIASKNLYELLGNDEDQDPDRRPVVPPVQPVDKTQARSGKRNAGPEPPVKENSTIPAASRGGARGGRGGRRGDASGNDAAMRDGARAQNQDRPTDETPRSDRPRGGRGARGQGYEGRGGGRGSRARGTRDDRHSRSGFGPNDHAKQAAHAWGDSTAAGELNDEKAGETIALEEEKNGFDSTVDAPVNADGDALKEETATAEPEVEAEPEDKTKSYVAYLAELAEKKLQLGNTLAPRQANEGSSKKQPEGKAYTREEGEEYFAGSGGKKLRERERKDKNVLVLDHDIQAREREREATRGGRGGRGGRGRGEGSFRGEGRGRGGRGRGEGRGEFRGQRGGRGGASTASPNVADESSFPSLGA